MGRLVKIVAGIAILYIAGFLLFIFTLPSATSPAQRADGIVALTGGNARVDAAVALLERGAGRRLLITGVHPTTTKAELRLLSHGGRRFDCCTDLGHVAENTRGNAEEAAAWAHTHRYKSLIIVTAAYHMPRSLTEFQAAMPKERLVAYPVEPDGADLQGWWHDPAALHLLHNEYAKYLASFVITRFGGESSSLDRSAAERKVSHES
jgi:uncharacterized SAM-binding protein YcdF (DUF218 family)